MAKLPEPDWITLSECPERVEQAFGVERHKVETALVEAFHDGKIRTRGRCRSYFAHERLDDVARSSWDRVSVVWQANKFTIFYGRDPLHIFSDVVVCREDLAKWINGAMGIGQHLTPKPVQPKTPLAERRKVWADRLEKSKKTSGQYRPEAEKIAGEEGLDSIYIEREARRVRATKRGNG